MPSVLIRSVPDETHERLKQKASAEGMSLQAFLVRVLESEAKKPIRGEWAAEVERRLREAGAQPGDITPEQVVGTIHEQRQARERDLDEVLRRSQP